MPGFCPAVHGLRRAALTRLPMVCLDLNTGLPLLIELGCCPRSHLTLDLLTWLPWGLCHEAGETTGRGACCNCNFPFATLPDQAVTWLFCICSALHTCLQADPEADPPQATHLPARSILQSCTLLAQPSVGPRSCSGPCCFRIKSKFLD